MSISLRTVASVAVALILTAALPTTAEACGCGAFVSDSKLRAVQETALITVGDGQQSFSMNIATTQGGPDGKPEVAFVMPVPGEASFALDNPDLFSELDDYTKPEVETVEVTEEVEILGLGGSDDGATGGAAPPGSGVEVLDQLTLGPYEVVQLSGSVGEVVTWLQDNGFAATPELSTGLADYLAKGWNIVAAKLSVEGSSGFNGSFPPMRVSFAADEVIYPMLLTALAQTRQQLRLYVLADHRMDISGPTPTTGDASLTFADWVQPDALAAYPRIDEQVSDTQFLTRYDHEFNPQGVTEDVVFTTAANDTTYREVITKYEYVMSPWTIVVSIAFWGGIAALIGGVVFLIRRGMRT